MSKDKTAIVTGAASGLGKAIADELKRRDFSVVSYDRRYGDDVARPEASMARDYFPAQLDVLINCAGVNKISWLEDLTKEDWDETINTNAWGIVRMTQFVLPILKAAKGTVLNIVSNASHTPMRGSAAYNASKGAAHILTLQLARELYSRHDIIVFGISPNRLADTAMSQSIDFQVVRQRGWSIEEARRYQRASLPIGEETDPLMLAEYIGFLLETKDRHRFLHGCVLPYGV